MDLVDNIFKVNDDVPPELIEEKRIRVQKHLQHQRKHALVLFFLFIGISLIFAIRRGHPKNWRVSQGWVEMWGGDWNKMTKDIAHEKVIFESTQLFLLQREESCSTPGSTDCCMTEEDCLVQFNSFVCKDQEECLGRAMEISVALEAKRKVKQLLGNIVLPSENIKVDGFPENDLVIKDEI